MLERYQHFTDVLLKKRKSLEKSDEIFVVFTEREWYDLLFFNVYDILRKSNITKEDYVNKIRDSVWDNFIEKAVNLTDSNKGIGPGGKFRVCIETGYSCGRVFDLDELAEIYGEILFNIKEKYNV